MLLSRIVINPTWRDQLGEAGRQRVEIAFSWHSVASRLTQIYTHLLAQTMPSIESKPQVAA
jgi:glycosyltransferase involved in cell wall biosynthesis